MSNNKQSSVEWLIAELGEYFPQGIGGIELMVNKAKAIHKEEVTSFTADWSIQYKYENGKNINQFYNETFGGNNDKKQNS